MILPCNKGVIYYRGGASYRFAKMQESCLELVTSADIAEIVVVLVAGFASGMAVSTRTGAD